MGHHIIDPLRAWLLHYGYWAVAAVLLLESAGLPTPGEPVLLLSSFLAYSKHELHLSWIIFVGTVACTLGGNTGYLIGYYGGRPLLERYQNIFRIGQPTLERGEKLFGRYGSETIFFARFVFGMRTIAGPLAGVLRMPWQKFTIFNLAGAALWVTVMSLVGYFFGGQWRQLVYFIKRFDLVLVFAFLLVLLLLWWRGRRTTPQP
jgi:membrane protein DedA with SNARE-associated domain